MDPITTLRELLYAILCEDGERAEELAQALHDWLERGGFAPLPESGRYQGWKNRQTWAVHHWLANDQDLDDHCSLLAEESIALAPDCGQVADGSWRIEEAPRRLLHDQLTELVDSRNPLRDEETVFADLLGSALYVVDWDEIAESFLRRQT